MAIMFIDNTMGCVVVKGPVTKRMLTIVCVSARQEEGGVCVMNIGKCEG